MTKELKEKYLKLGVLERHFDYAVSAVKSGTKREIILKNLTSDVRKMEKSISSSLELEAVEIESLILWFT